MVKKVIKKTTKFKPVTASAKKKKPAAKTVKRQIPTSGRPGPKK